MNRWAIFNRPLRGLVSELLLCNARLIRESCNDLVANLGGGQSFLLQSIDHQRFINTDGTVSCVIIFKATVKTLVSHATVTVTIAGHLRDRRRDLFYRLVGFARFSGELR